MLSVVTARGCLVVIGNHSDSHFLFERGEGSWRRGEESTFEGVTLSL